MLDFRGVFPINPPLLRLLVRLKKETLISIVESWLSSPSCQPHIPEADDEDNINNRNGDNIDIEKVREVYKEMQNGAKKRAVVERIAYTDWVSRLTRVIQSVKIRAN